MTVVPGFYDGCDNVWVMSELKSEEAASKGRLLQGLAPWADTISKALAGIAIALYACGFLTVSLYHARFGFTATNPFRPKVLIAGAWFLLLTAIPVSIALQYKSKNWLEVARNSYVLWVLCISLGLPLTYLFDVPVSGYGLSRWYWYASIGWVLLVVLLKILESKKTTPGWILTVISVLATLCVLAGALRGIFPGGQFTSSTLALWFFASALAVKLEMEVRSDRNLAEDGEWSKPLALFCTLLFVFSWGIYPHLKASWGGGLPVNVTLYLNKESALAPSTCIQAQMIEESDDGFYVVGSGESKAVFLPRRDVALIYFSDKPEDSTLLKQRLK
jgi:hypothetical protein